MLRFSRDLAIANGRWETDRDAVEFPIARVLLQASNEICWTHFRSGIELALIGALHQQLHVRAADIDDQRLVHRLVNCELLAKPDCLTEALENAFALLPGAGCRPAFYNFKREEAEKADASKFQIESQIFCNLLDRTNAVELRRELRLGHGEPEILRAFESIARVSGNRGRLVVS